MGQAEFEKYWIFWAKYYLLALKPSQSSLRLSFFNNDLLLNTLDCFLVLLYIFKLEEHWDLHMKPDL